MFRPAEPSLDVVKKLFAQLRIETRAEGGQAALDQLEVLCRGFLTSSDIGEFEKCHLTPMEARIISCLRFRIGERVLRGSVMDALYFDRTETTSTKSIDSLVFTLRRKIRPLGYAIHTIPRFGYRLCKETGAATAH